jgi:hypothetical protein
MAAAPWLGDFSTTAIVVAEWGTYNSSGASVTRNVNGTVSVFESTSTVALASTSITDSEDYRGITGAHRILVDLNIASTLVTIGRDYSILLANSSVDSATVSAPLATFSVRNRALRPSSTGGVTVATNNDKTGYTITGSSTVIAGAVWGTTRSAHASTDTFGESNSTAFSVTVGTNNDKTGYTITGSSVAISGAVWGTTRSAFASTGTFGDIPSSAAFPPNLSILAVSTTGYVTVGTLADGVITDAKIATAAITATKFAAGAIDAAALSADAGAEIAAAVGGRTLPELTGDPTATPTANAALMLPYMAIRNKRDTNSTSDEIHNDAGSVILTAAISDLDSTFTKAKYA